MAMKEFEMAEVAAGVPDDDYYGGGGPGSTGVDAGQQSLLSGGEMMSDEMKAGDGPGLGDGQTVWCGCMSIRFYQQFFQVNTKDVTERWLHSILSFKREKEFLEIIEDNPDAYGPFWNATSLIFLMALTTNLSDEGYDLTTLITSTWVVYGFATVGPVLFWLALNQVNIPMPLIKVVCIYGYSLGPFLPAVLICALPIPFLDFVALAGAGVLSVVFLLQALTPTLLEKNRAVAGPAMAGLGLTQALLTLILKFGFFT